MLAKMVFHSSKVCRNGRQIFILLLGVAVVLWTFVTGRFKITSFNMHPAPAPEPTPERTTVKPLDVNNWYSEQMTACGRNFTAYGQKFFSLYSPVYHPAVDVFSIICAIGHLPPSNLYKSRYAPQKYTRTLTQTASKFYNNDITYKQGITVAVYREYPHNFYHAMTQWYNIFMLSKVFRFNIENATILLLDRTIPTHIDVQWTYHYRQVIFAGNLTTPTKFENVIFNIPGHESPLYYYDIANLPFINEFSERFLQTFGLRSDKTLNCKNLTVVLYVRHDYYFHPGVDKVKRNTERKLKNEDELVAVLKEEFKGHNVRTLVSEELSLEEQLRLAIDTDVLIGMHGCGLTHILFMPKHATVLELYPITWTLKYFFSSFAKWRTISHEYWRNTDPKFETKKDHYTFVPPKIFRDYAKRAMSNLGCIPNDSKEQNRTKLI